MTLPAPPAPRLAYDADGTIIFVSRSSGDDRTPYELSPGAMTGLNSDVSGGLIFEDDMWNIKTEAGYYYAPNYISLIFPHPTDLYGWFASARAHWAAGTSSWGWPLDGSHASLRTLAQVSYNTTNGLDGDWETIAEKTQSDYHLGVTDFSRLLVGGDVVWEENQSLLGMDARTGERSSLGAPMQDSNIFATYFWGVQSSLDVMYRNEGPTGPGWSSFSEPALGVKGFRLYFPSVPTQFSDWYPTTSFLYSALVNLHLYGNRQDNVSHRLSIVGADGSDDFDLSLGDVDIEESVEASFRVKNLSATQDALLVGIYMEDSGVQYLPSIAPWVQLSLDGVVWGSTVEIPAILSGESSEIIHLRFLPGSTAIGRKFARVGARAREWS